MAPTRMVVVMLVMVAAMVATGLGSSTRQTSSPGTIERRLYVANDRGGISIYEIDRGHKLLRTIAIANPGVGEPRRHARLSRSPHRALRLDCRDSNEHLAR